jgi:cell fate regulator YaaT (PSP1 superfamily)
LWTWSAISRATRPRSFSRRTAEWTFRDLVKDLAGIFRNRIELRQIGVRDEAKMLGGLGICGRPYCCSQFLDDFEPVSTKDGKDTEPFPEPHQDFRQLRQTYVLPAI